MRHDPVGAGGIDVNLNSSLPPDPPFMLLLDSADSLLEGFTLWLFALQVGPHLCQPFSDQSS